MKLIDILVQHKEEIVEPGEATNYLAMDPDGRVFGYQEKPDPNVVGWSVPGALNSTDGNGCLVRFDPIDLKENWSECIVTREQYEAALAASKQEWNGEGLPPVGLVCEGQFPRHPGNSFEWQECLVLYAFDRECAVKSKVTSTLHYCDDFRPIRSEADKKRDEAIGRLIEVLNAGMNTEDDGKNIYEYIAAGKIPGIRID